ISFVRGGFRDWDAWEPALRCLYSGTPIYDPKNLDLRDLDGSPLDIRKSFSASDDPRRMSHFLRTAGYLHVRAAFSQAEIARLSDEVDRMRDSAVEGDIFSRWAASSDGEKKVWDLHYMALNSPIMKDLDQHRMVTFLTGLSQEDVVPALDRDNGTHAILREFTGATNVDSNYMLGWHQDCGLGGCPITCPRVHVGIQLDAATPDSSQLFFLAGSAGRTCHDQFPEEAWENLPVVAFETEPGDVTVHLGCTLHAAPKENGINRRRTIYTRFVNPMVTKVLDQFMTFDQVIPHVDAMPSIEAMIATVEA
ncbi:MAG: phytanoyl-CoA dioxygenase family protein, partial [Gammaproteobacteria bacterium]